VVFLVFVALAAFAGVHYWQQIKAYATSLTAPTATAGGRGRGAGGGNIPVVAGVVKRGDVHIYLDGLGQVTPFKTVTVRSQVDGQITKIAFDEGQLVHEGDVIAQIDDGPYKAALEEARGKLASDQAFLENSKIDLKRYRDAGTAVSNQQLETQQAVVDQYQANVVSDQGQVDAANVNLAYCRITSPITGRIGLRLVDLGNIVHTTDTTGIAVITQLQPIAVVFAINEDYLNEVVTKPNFGEGLPVLAYDRDDQTLITTGSILAVDNMVSPSTGTFNVKATFDNKDNKLFPQQFVNAHLLADVLTNKVLAPVAAVQHGPAGEAFVYVVNQDQTVQTVNVTEGPQDGDWESVTGIDAGTVVVTDGTDKLIDGAKVTATMQSENGTPTTAPTTRSGRGRRGGGGRGGARPESATQPSDAAPQPSETPAPGSNP
jgi:multidrug efflux system membrane fusion protein